MSSDGISLVTELVSNASQNDFKTRGSDISFAQLAQAFAPLHEFTLLLASHEGSEFSPQCMGFLFEHACQSFGERPSAIVPSWFHIFCLRLKQHMDRIRDDFSMESIPQFRKEEVENLFKEFRTSSITEKDNKFLEKLLGFSSGILVAVSNNLLPKEWLWPGQELSQLIEKKFADIYDIKHNFLTEADDKRQTDTPTSILSILQPEDPSFVASIEIELAEAQGPIIEKINEWLQSFSGKSFESQSAAKESVEQIIHLARRTGCHILYNDQPATLSVVIGTRQKKPTIQIRGRKAGKRIVLLNSIKIPELTVAPIP